MQKIAKAPFLKDRTDSKYLMLDVIIALIPVCVMAVVKFGIRALFIMLLGVASCVLFEWLWNKYKHEETTITDLSAVVTGLLLSLSFVVNVPYWIVVFASFIAIIVIKQIPGGIGKNTFNPAVFARVFCKITLTPYITNWVSPLPDMVSAATPLEFISHGAEAVPDNMPMLSDLFMGNIGGNIGEPVKWAIIIGYIYLVARRTINPWMPIATLGGLFLTMTLFGQSDYYFGLYHILSGTAMFGAVFMVTDYTSGPVNYKARIVYALFIGIFMGILRYLFNLPGGLGIAILTMNLFAPFFDMVFVPRVFGFMRPISVFNDDH